MKIAIIGARSFFVNYGGIEKYCYKIYTNIPEGYTFDIYTLNKYEYNTNNDYVNINIRSIETSFIKRYEKLFYAFTALKHLLNNKYNIIHVHGLNSGFLIPIIKLISPSKLVFTLHSEDFKYGNWNILEKYILYLIYKFTTNADCYIVVSNIFKNNLKNKYLKSIYVLPPGIETYEKKESFPKNNYILCVGRITRDKGQVELIKVFLKSKCPLRLVFVGPFSNDFDYEQEFNNKVNKQNRISYLGRVDSNKLMELLYGSDLFISNSKFEGYPISLCEALSINKPVLVSGIDSHEQFKLNKLCYYQNERELLFKLDNIKEIIKIRNKVELFTWKQIASSHSNLYKKIC